MRFTRRDAVTAVLGAATMLAVVVGLGFRRGESSLPRGVAAAAREEPRAPEAPAAVRPLPALAIEGPRPLDAGPRWPDAPAATQLDAAGLWAWVRQAARSGDEGEWHQLDLLVRATRSRGVAEQVWEALWARIQHPEATGADPQATLDEASVLARAVLQATGDRSYQMRVQEYVRARDRETPRRQFVEERVAEAQKAWSQQQNAELARARLDAARTAAQRLPNNADLLRSIDALEVQLPPLPPRTDAR
jgi:hypothetical protein